MSKFSLIAAAALLSFGMSSAAWAAGACCPPKGATTKPAAKCVCEKCGDGACAKDCKDAKCAKPAADAAK